MTNPSTKTIILTSVFGILLITYFSSAAQVPSGYGDSDELITTAYLHGVAHPPGYGINLYLINCFQHLLSFLSPAHAANLFAGFCHALAITLLCSTALTIIDNVDFNHEKRALYLGAMAGSIAAGLGGLYWLYSSVIEVMSLGDLFVALIIFVSTKWYFSTLKNRNFIFLISVLFGLAVSHLQSIILLAPGLLYLFIIKINSSAIRRITVLACAAFIFTASFLIGSASILPNNHEASPVSWDFPETISGWWRMVTRADYQGFNPDRNTTVSNAYLVPFGLDRLNAIPIYLISLINQYAGIYFLLPLLGIVSIWHKQKKYTKTMLITYGCAGLMLGIYTAPPSYHPGFLEYRLLMAVSERQYLIGYTILSVFTIIGASVLLDIIRKAVSTRFSKRLLTLIYIWLLPFSMLIANKSIGDKSQESTYYRYSSDIMDTAAPGSVIICSGDISCFSLFYKSLIETYRPDVTILSKIPKLRQKYLRLNLDYVGYIYPDNPFFFAQEVAWNTSKRPTYLTNLDSYSIHYLGLEGNPFYLLPQGRLFQVSTTYPSTFSDQIPDPNLTSLMSQTSDERDFFKLGALDFYASLSLIKAQLYTKYGAPQRAIPALETALALNHANATLANWRLRLNELSQSIQYPKTEKINITQSRQIVQYLLEQQQYRQAYDLTKQIYYLDPTSPETVSLLIQIYQQSGDEEWARIEKNHLSTLTH